MMSRLTPVAVAALAAACTGGGEAAAPPGVAVVQHVVDGDTIDVVIGGARERVRLLGIDTPETHVADGPPECFGPEASARTKALLPAGTAVRLERDVVGRDDYGRLLAYVYRHADGLFVNDALVRNGYAVPLSIAPNRAFAGQFVNAAVAAEAGGLGLWQACGG